MTTSVRTAPKLGAIGVVNTGDSLTARTVRWFTARQHDGRWERARVNHAVLYIGDAADPGSGKQQAIEAQPGRQGARLIDWDLYGDKTVWIDTPDIRTHYGTEVVYEPVEFFSDSLENYFRQRIARFGASLVGTPYNKFDILAVGWGQRRFRSEESMAEFLKNPPKWVRIVADPSRLICSQLVDLAWEYAGIHLFQDGRLPGLVSPEDLYELMPVREAAGQLHAVNGTTN